MAPRRALAALALATVALASTAGAQTAGAQTAGAQTADSTATPGALSAPPLSHERPLRRAATPVPAVTSALTPETLLGRGAVATTAPSVFDYTLGAPGRSGGLSLDGLDPARAALALDGRPFDDLVTGAPRFDLLPLGALGPIQFSEGRFGQPMSVEAATRAFRLGRPVTELRYLAGQSGVQAVSGTHAQTRLPPAFLRGGSRSARLTLAGHVMSRSGRGTLTGATLRHTDVLARSLLARPGLVLDAGLLHTDRTDGARRGIVSGTAPDIFDLSASVREPTATRRTARTEMWASAQTRTIFVQPVTVTLSGVTERLVYRSDAADTLRVHAGRAAVQISQPLGRDLLLRLDALGDTYPSATSASLGSPRPRLRIHAALHDSVAVGALTAAIEGGVHAVGGRVYPSVSVRARRERAFASVRAGGSVPGRVEASGLSGFVDAGPTGPGERVFAAEVGADFGGRVVQLGARAFGTSRQNARLLVARDTSFAYETAPAALSVAGATLSARVREAATRGLYGHLATTAHVPIRPGTSALHRREADALPRLHATARIGTRAVGVGGVLDLDLAVVGRAWTAFRGRVVEPRTGLLALPDPETDLGAVLPARGTLGAEATATFSRRATVFLQVDHALGQIVGAAVVQGRAAAGPRAAVRRVLGALGLIRGRGQKESPVVNQTVDNGLFQPYTQPCG